MATNIEIKIQIGDLEPVRRRAQRIANRGPFVLSQVDYFFPVANGRLKLRVEKSDLPGHENKAELIAYARSDEARGRASDYEIYSTGDWASLYANLRAALGEGPVVRKQRELYLAGRTRIHLDTVEGLGAFVEIEVVMQPDELATEGHRELQQLMTDLHLNEETIVEVAYADLIAGNAKAETQRRTGTSNAKGASTNT